MDKEDSIFFTIWFIVAIIGAVMIGYFSYPKVETVNVWLPSNYSYINNAVNGVYYPVNGVDFSDTAVTVSFDDYKNQFSDSKNFIILQKDNAGITIYYFTKNKEIKYVSSLSYGGNSLRYTDRIQRISDSEIGIHYNTQWGLFLLFVIVDVIVSFLFSLYVPDAIIKKVHNMGRQ